MERIAMAEQVMAWAHAQQVTDLAELAQAQRPLFTSPHDHADASHRADLELSSRHQAEAEVAAALTWSRRQASVRLDDALTLASLPVVMSQLRSGLIDTYRARTIAGAMTNHLQPSSDPAADAARWSAVERRICERAPDRTAGQLRSDIARAALAVDPEAAERRREKARQQREVRHYPRPDGMASIEATLDAESAAIIDAALTLLADAARDAAARAGTTDARTHQQRRADAFTGIFTAILNGTPLPMHLLHDQSPMPATTPPFSSAGPEPFGADDLIPESFMRPTPRPGSSGTDPHRGTPFVAPPAVPAWWEPPALPSQQRRRPHLVITIHADTLAGLDDLAADLAGHGAITAQAARDLARQAGTAALLVLGQPPGAPGTTAEDRYRPGNQVVRDVIARNPTCRAPGCQRCAEQCDLDHLIPHGQGGRTEPGNLIPLCRFHHRLKTFGGWSPALRPAGPADPAPAIEWTSPTGRHYLAPPDDRPGTTHW